MVVKRTFRKAKSGALVGETHDAGAAEKKVKWITLLAVTGFPLDSDSVVYPFTPVGYLLSVCYSFSSPKYNLLGCDCGTWAYNEECRHTRLLPGTNIHNCDFHWWWQRTERKTWHVVRGPRTLGMADDNLKGSQKFWNSRSLDFRVTT